MTEKLYYIDTPKACGGITVDGDRIVEPLCPWWWGWFGQSWSRFKAQVRPTRIEEIRDDKKTDSETETSPS